MCIHLTIGIFRLRGPSVKVDCFVTWPISTSLTSGQTHQVVYVKLKTTLTGTLLQVDHASLILLSRPSHKVVKLATSPCGLSHKVDLTKWILQSGPFYLSVVLTTLVYFTWYKSKTCTFNMWTWTKWQRKISVIGDSSLKLMWTTAILLWTHFPSVKSAGIMSLKKNYPCPFLYSHTNIISLAVTLNCS